MSILIHYSAIFFTITGVFLFLLTIYYKRKTNEDLITIKNKISIFAKSYFLLFKFFINRHVLFLFFLVNIYLFFKTNYKFEFFNLSFSTNLAHIPSIVFTHLFVSLFIIKLSFVKNLEYSHNINYLFIHTICFLCLLYLSQYTTIYILQFSRNPLIAFIFIDYFRSTDFFNYFYMMTIYNAYSFTMKPEATQTYFIVLLNDYLFFSFRFYLVFTISIFFIYLLYLLNAFILAITLKRFLRLLNILSFISVFVALFDFLLTLNFEEIKHKIFVFIIEHYISNKNIN